MPTLIGLIILDSLCSSLKTVSPPPSFSASFIVSSVCSALFRLWSEVQLSFMTAWYNDSLCVCEYGSLALNLSPTQMHFSIAEERKRDGSRVQERRIEWCGVEWSACTCHGQSNNSINLLHKSMRYWQYDDEAETGSMGWYRSTRDEPRRHRRRRLLHPSLTCIMQKLSGQELELSKTWLWLKSIKWKCFPQFQSQFQVPSPNPRWRFGLWPRQHTILCPVCFYYI